MTVGAEQGSIIVAETFANVSGELCIDFSQLEVETLSAYLVNLHNAIRITARKDNSLNTKDATTKH